MTDIDELIAGLVKDARNIAAGDLGAGDRKDALTNINSTITALQEMQKENAELYDRIANSLGPSEQEAQLLKRIAELEWQIKGLKGDHSHE